MPATPENPNWKDRATMAVYARTIHHACICQWEKNSDLFKLVRRVEHCVIHGKHGHV